MIDVSELEEFTRKCEAAAADLKPYAAKTLEECGEEFLDMVQLAIMNAENIDTRKLLGSFTKGGAGNVFQLDAGALQLTIGTNVYYAKWVNKGHRQRPGRFVPGVFEGTKFRYVAGAKTGIVLKANYVIGSHFFDQAVEQFEGEVFPKRIEEAFENFWKRYFD